MSKNKIDILVVDDDILDLETITMCLKDKYKVLTFNNASCAEEFLRKEVTPLIILDLNLNSSEDGLQILRKWKTIFPDTEIIFCSGETSVARVVQCLRNGASDFVVKPFTKDELIEATKNALEKSLTKRKAGFSEHILNPFSSNFIGQSKPILEILRKAKIVANKEYINVLIMGESGTGKEILARFIHDNNRNPSRPFVVANMPAIPNSLIEAELFGVEKGAYTDAKFSRPGKFEIADGGDIFLDEIGDLSVEMQAKLLRVLQNAQIERIGSSRVRRLKFRVISATNQPLCHLIKNGKFREDLFFRLSDVIFELPPLNERKEDIPLFVDFFIKKYGRGRKISFTSQAMGELLNYDWPGNVRELESTIKRTLIYCDFDEITKFDLLPSNKERESSYRNYLIQCEKELLSKIIDKHGGNKKLSREELRLSKTTFYRKLKELGIN